MVYQIHLNSLIFQHAGESEWHTVVFPIKSHIHCICHRTVEKLILVGLADYSNTNHNENNNVFAVDDRTGKILWRIKEGDPKELKSWVPRYLAFIEDPNGRDVYCLDPWENKWKIDLKTGNLELFEIQQYKV